MSTIDTLEELEQVYGAAAPASLTKEIDHVSDHYRAYIEAAPFMVIASVGPDGADCSPRGDPAESFVRVADPKTLLIPDRRGNNRVDTLRNIVVDGRVGLLFLLPGVGTTMRVNGRAVLDRDPSLCDSFAIKGKVPASVIRVTVDSCYFQCPKALIRSKLWDPASHVDEATLPSTGTMISARDKGFDGAAYDRNYPERVKQTIY